MAFRGNRRQQRFNHGHMKYRNEHDDRGHNLNHSKNSYNDFTVYRGNDRSNRVPDGHWRGGGGGIGGNRDRRGGNFRGQRNNRPPFRDHVEGDEGRPNRQNMFKSKRKNRHYQSNANDNWNKIVIKDAGPLDKEEVMYAIRNLVEHPFTPIMYEPEGNNRVFYLEDNFAAARAIQDLNRRVSLRSGQKLTIHLNRAAPPSRAITAEQIEQIKVVMSDRYCVELKRLDLMKFHSDSNLVKADIFCPLNRIANMKIIVDVIISNIPLVEEIDFSSNRIYTLEETGRLVGTCPNIKRINFRQNKMNNIETLQKLHGLDLVDLTLEGNPLCDKFRDTETYIRQVPWIYFLNPD